MKKIFLLILCASLFGSQVVMAQEESSEEEGTLTLSGSVDAYFRTNFNAPNKGENFQAPASSFGNLPGFSLGMANIIATYQGKKVGAVADLVFGPRGEDAVFGSPLYANGMAGSSQIVNQLYVYWNVSDKVTLTFGNFNTFLGYEVISPTANFNYSTSYMFSYGPFSHTGLKANFQLSDKFSFLAAVMNPTDMTEFNLNGTYTLGAQLGYSTDLGSTYLNFVYGDQDGRLSDDGGLITDQSSLGKTFQVDLTTGFDLSEKFYLGVNTTYNTTSAGEFYTGSEIQDLDGDGAGFYGFAGYLQVKPTEKFGLGFRGEYFSVFNNGLEGVVGIDPSTGDGGVFAATLSGNIKVGGNLTLIPELRVDSMKEEFFVNKDLNGSKGLASFLFAAVFAF
ncbi:putative OmpL-like beta-barrel porin-2 [Algoriphagus boseongensis]|uniref:Putative OmpL-like beta-barrel porin-2 n=1 Tax=Algoriphagus boseongensis TaxID=1442587 RepID=A0A4R6T324_9BACT|nr:porin [Algoriphagus boseongensis]TDQ14941.1 putative OmpL-like beta-barrel porin-2 [Algoriphagus boseongensis]